MALAPPIQSTVLDDFWNKRARGVDVTGAIQPKSSTQADVDAALAYGLQNQKDKRLAAISQQNANTAQYAAEQEGRALDKAISMNQTALPFQLAQQAFGAQGLIPLLFGGTTGQGEGATQYPGLINQAGSALGTIGGGLSSAYNWLTGGGNNTGNITGLEGKADQWTGQAASDQMNALSVDNTGQSGSDAGIQNFLLSQGLKNAPSLISGAESLLGDLGSYTNDFWSGLSDSGLGEVFGNAADDWGNIDMSSWWGNGDIFSNLFSTNEISNLFKDWGDTDMFSSNYTIEDVNNMFGDWGF